MTTPAPDCTPYLQAAFDEYAGAQVLAATGPLNAQIGQLTGQANSNAATIADLTAQLAASKAVVAADDAQIAALKAQIPAPPVTPTPTPTGPPLPTGWTKTTFFDDFTGDLGKWNVRNNTTANNELSVDTSRPSNVLLDPKAGSVTLRAQREAMGGRSYTSGYLDTIGKFSQRYGRWEVRAKLPASKGVWPAFWLRCDGSLGEVDILEAVGGYPSIVQTVHQSTNGNMDKLGYEWKPPAGWSYTDRHVYAFEWDPSGAMRWYIDGNLSISRTVADLGNPSHKPAAWLSGPDFATPANIRLNLQVGGSMPASLGQPVDASTQFPADFVIDYVRALTR